MSRVPNVASVYIVQSVLCCAVFIFGFVMCLVCLMLPVSRLSILCVVFIFVFVMCLVCLMLPVSRLSILCVVLCLFLSSACVSCA